MKKTKDKKENEIKDFKEFLKVAKEDLKKNKLRLLKDLLIYSWKGDDLISYVLFLFLLLSFYLLFLKPLIFPLLFHTEKPFNVIVSGSMEHYLPFDEWWQKYGRYYETHFNITKNQFAHFPYRDGLFIGDLVIIKGTPKKNIRVGDIIVYYVPSIHKDVIHRVVKIKNESGKICFETVGDNNVRFYYYGQDPQLWFEKNVCNVEGKVILRIPYLGLPRYWLYKFFGV